jgi:hypothetical protein
MCFHLFRHRIGSVSESDDIPLDNTDTESPYPGQDSAPESTTMPQYYDMRTSGLHQAPVPEPEDYRFSHHSVPSHPQANIRGLRAPAISQQTGIIGPTRPPASVQRPQDAQTSLPYQRSSFEREQRQVVPQGRSTSRGAHSSMSGQLSDPYVYTTRSRTRHDSLPPRVPPAIVQHDSRESESPSPVSWQPAQSDPWGPAQWPTQPVRGRDSDLMAPLQPPPRPVHISLVDVPQELPAGRMRRATVPLPSNPPHQTRMRRASESRPRSRGTLVSTCVRFDDDNLICPSPIPMNRRRKGWYNRRGYVPSSHHMAIAYV